MNKVEIVVKITDKSGVQTIKFNAKDINIEQFRGINPIYNDKCQICDFEGTDEITLVITAKLEKPCEN